MTPRGRSKKQATTGRELLALALPALGALVAEPLFVLADSAMIGHLGTDQLAGVGVAGTLIQTAVALLIFLAYGTTPAVSRLIGAGRRADALAAGRDGVALSIVLGCLLVGVGLFLGPMALRGLGARGSMYEFSLIYLLWSLPGLVAMLAVLALVGVFRGLGDATTPLWVAGLGAGLNVILNAILIYGLGLGVAGSGLGTSLTQWVMAISLGLLLVRSMRSQGVSFIPSLRGILRNAGAGVWLVLRSVAMRVSILSMLWVVTSWGPQATAGHHILMALFSLMALALDAIAIAAQTMIARELGAGRGESVLEYLRTMLRWGFVFGGVTAILLGVCAPWIAGWFGQEGLRGSVMLAVLVLALAQPLCSFVFVLDGVLIGAQDLRYLGAVSVATTAFFFASLLAVRALLPPGEIADPTPHLAVAWVAWAFGFMGARALSLWLRARGGKWIRLGAEEAG